MTRKEAIERIKTRFDKWALDNEDMKAIQTLILELAESEDERIRKYIVKFVELEKGVNLPPDDADKMLAYLEKQKEQKHADIPSSGSGAMGTTPPAYKLDVKPATSTNSD